MTTKNIRFPNTLSTTI